MRCLFLLCFWFSSLSLCSQIIPEYSVTVLNEGSVGYYFFTAVKTGNLSSSYNANHIILDGKGYPVYFKQLKKGRTTSDFKIQPNGLMSYFDTDKFYFMDSTFQITDSMTWKNGALKDAHDLQINPNGHYLLLGQKEVKQNLNTHHLFKKGNSPGDTGLKVKIGVVQEYDRHKNLVFEWNSAMHFRFEDMDTLYAIDPGKADIPHLNSVESDTDGNLILSSRNYNEITKISRTTGEVIWRFGGRNNQFKFLGDSSRFFGQHSVRRLPNGHLLFYSNGIDSQLNPSSAREYELDEKRMTAKLVWIYTHNSSSFSTGIGNARRLANGNTLVNYGRSSNDNVMFDVVTPKGVKQFEIIFKDTLRAYRAFNYLDLPFKLNRPEINTIRKNGQLILEVADGLTEYMWSNGQTSKSINIDREGTYYLCVPVKSGGWLCSTPRCFDKLLNPVELK